MKTNWLRKDIDEIVTAIDDLNAAVTSLQDEQAALATAVTTAISDLQAQVAALQASPGDTAAIEAAVASIQGVVTNLQATQSAASAADPGSQAPPPAPPAPAAFVADPATGKPLYVEVDTTQGVDTTAWTAVTDVTDPGGKALYTFNADAAGGPATGVGGNWVLYTGTPTPAA
ncbi:MAG: hypothetical protein KGL39_04460 [Patescibacteria group bacterium]|nr:hypothetical protein [Patescibacteria group bacterium]